MAVSNVSGLTTVVVPLKNEECNCGGPMETDGCGISIKVHLTDGFQ